MESALEVPPKKPRLRQNLNLHVAECIRQFELPRQFPSTITELRLTKPSEKSTTTIQTKNMQNIISALPLPGKMKFIPNKEVSISENLQKLKLKLPDGRDLGEVKIVLPGQEEKLQTKVVTMSKIGQKSEKPITWTIKSQSPGESQKPRIKTVTRLYNNSLSSLEEHLKESEEMPASKMKVQLINGNHNSPTNVTPNNAQTKTMLSNLKRISTIDGHDSNKKIIIHNSDGDVIKKFIIGNPSMMIDKQTGQSQVITLKKLPGSQKMVMMQRDNNQLLKPLSDKPLSLKPITQSSLNNHNIKKNLEKIVFKSALNGSIVRKRDSSFIESSKSFENKKICSEIDLVNSNINEDHNTELIDGDQKKNNSPQLNNSVKQTINAGPRKNIMVFVPNEAAEKLTMVPDTAEVNKEEILQDGGSGVVLNLDNEMIPEVRQSNVNFKSEYTDIHINEDIVNCTQEEIQVTNISELNNTNKTLINKTTKSQDLIDRFNILKQAVLSVQDANLRTKALKALKDCGIKVKKNIPVKRPVATKMISESATQTEIFSLLKDNEFLKVTPVSEELIKIKQSRKIMKQPISTLSSNRSIHKVYSEQNKNEFKIDLDNALEKMFPACKGITDVKEAFVQNKIAFAKTMLKQLQIDLKAAKKYDSDGLLGIHRAVMNDNIQEVQRHMIMIKAVKESIDVCSQDNKTSLEISVEYEVNSQIIKILLDAGAQPVSSQPIHDSALILAAKTSSKILPLLFKYINRTNRSLLNAKNSDGFAAIHYCAQYGNLEGIIELLKHGVDVNLQDERSGRTALFYAVETKNGDVPQETYNEIAHKLLEHGAISNIPIFSKHSVLSLIDDVKSHALKIALNKAVK